MASSKKQPPENGSQSPNVFPARTPGIIGFFDSSDPNVIALLGDTPGSLGINDHAQPACIQPTLLGSILQPSFQVQSFNQLNNSVSIKDTGGSKSPTDLLPAPNPSAPRLSESDYQAAAKEMGIEVAVIYAVASVESSDDGFDKTGRPKILFEGLHFHKYTEGKYDKTHPHLSEPTLKLAQQYYSRDQWARMYEAMTLDVDASWRCASWGKFQVLGQNHNGWETVKDFVPAMFASEYNHLIAFMMFCRDNHLIGKLKNKKWADFARAYNGKDYALGHYDTKLQQAYTSFSKK